MADYAALAERIRRAAQPPVSLRVYGQQESLDGAERYDLFVATVQSQTPRPRFTVLLNGGTHGDEPAGAEAVVRFLETTRYTRWPDVAFTLTPCTNPWGYVHSRREIPGGRDLNRAFHRATRLTAQVTLYKRVLRGRRFDLFVDCHEDVDAPGLYVFARGGDLGHRIVEAVRAAGGPIHPGDLVDGEIPLLDGVVNFGTRRRRPRVGATRHLSGYVSRYHQPDPLGRLPLHRAPRASRPQPVSYAAATVETPTRLPIRQRVKMHLTAIDAALATLYER
jgi:hypothetical protein